ncbi:hypothetical protein V8G54_019172 [Vigna mungo]|uniref:Uncharacterized protein n=1 Tax=Vigna mungo TaxID=3915 RepID=A0AAQ3NBI1_VIGMU
MEVGGTHLTPILNLLLLCHLELSDMAILVIQAAPFLRVINLSPIKSGSLPSLSREMLDLNSSSVHSSLPSDPNSPFRTQISIFSEERGPSFTTDLVLTSNRAI